MRNARNGASAETEKLQSQKMLFQTLLKLLPLPSPLESVLFQKETLFFLIMNLRNYLKVVKFIRKRVY